MSVDYSQHGEQKFILQFFEGFTGRYLEIGAFDGITGSNTRCLSDRGWCGVSIEANPFMFPRLLEHHYTNPKSQCVNAAVMPSNGLVELFDTGSQVTTCLKDNRIGEYVRRKYHIASVTPQQIADSFGDEFHFVSLDIEGLDLPVLREMGPLLKHTKLLCVEDTIPGCELDDDYYRELRSVCAGHGFTMVVGRTYSDGVKPANTLLAKA